MDEALKAELRARAQADQAARLGDDFSLVIKVDAENLRWLKRFIDEHGWPGADLVGEDGAHAAWLLAQHASADRGFQRRCLDLMTAAVEAGEAARQELAYLTDRVLLAEGQPQVYGTQLISRGGGPYQLQELRDPDEVDARRAAAGLGPLAAYLARFTDRPAPAPARRLRCLGCGNWVPFDPPEPGETWTFSCPECGRQATGTYPG